MRPRQWLKNAVVFAPIIFQGKFFEPAIFFKGSLAFIFFSIIASGVYIINDINDYEKDREHPIKKNRPIASGLVSIRFAMIFAIIIFAIFIPFSYIFVGKYFGLILSLYLLMQIAYSLKLKNIIIVDALSNNLIISNITITNNENVIVKPPKFFSYKHFFGNRLDISVLEFLMCETKYRS